MLYHVLYHETCLLCTKTPKKILQLFFCYNVDMAIKKNGPVYQIEETDAQKFDIYNGDWEALKAATEKWGFRDEESALRFALAVLTIAKPGGLVINGDNMGPAESLLKESDGGKK